LYVHQHFFLLVTTLTLTHKVTYNATFPTDLADELTNSLPTAIVSLLQKGFLHHKATLEPERFDALSRAGFKVERYGTLAHHLYERSGGHYVDVGASAKISKGLVSHAIKLFYVFPSDYVNYHYRSKSNPTPSPGNILPLDWSLKMARISKQTL
jgi:hypothetical protein